MKGSLVASILAWGEAAVWNRERLNPLVDRFICPSHFMADAMTEGGFDSEKIAVIPNFIYPEMERMLREAVGKDSDGDYYCYVGRLSQEKGVETLLKVASRMPYRLMIAGDGPEAESLKSRYGNEPNITFLGQCAPQQVAELLKGARCSVIPSEWAENCPLGVIESLCAGTPVVGARIGGIPELIESGSGILFESGKADSLESAIETTFNQHFNRDAIRENALRRFNCELYYSELYKIYSGG
jgi:glycosyltransferase involved in cell wall biosynthesis